MDSGPRWPSAGCSGWGARCPALRGPWSPSSHLPQGSSGRTSSGQAKMLPEGSTLVGKLPGPSSRGCTHGESLPCTFLCLEFCYCACLSPLQSERCTDLSDHSAQPPHLQKTEAQDKSLGLRRRLRDLSLMRHGSKCPECLPICPHVPSATPKLSVRQTPGQAPHGPLPSPSSLVSGHCPPGATSVVTAFHCISGPSSRPLVEAG